MSVPTISTVTPNELVANTRQLVEITGTNFNKWATLPWPNSGVAVFFVFGAEEFLCNNIMVISDTQLYVEAFRYMGSPSATTFSADVKVVNLDANGNPQPGEEATLADAVTYYKDQHLPGDKNAGDDFLKLAIEEVLLTFQRTIMAEVAISTHTEWYPDGHVEHFVAEFPTLAFTGFSLTPIPHTPYDPDRDRTEGEEEEYLPTEYFWLDWSIVPMSDDPRELAQLWQALVRMGQRIRNVLVPKAPGSTDRVEIQFTLDPAGNFGFNYGVGAGTVTMGARLGPMPLESPEVVNRVWTVEEAFLSAFANVQGTGDSRDTTFYP